MSEQRHSALAIHGLQPHETVHSLHRGQILHRAKNLAAAALILLALARVEP